jgi:hypothetical protein
MGAPSDGSPVVRDGWTTRYAARRIAWRILEHAREMQDRTPSARTTAPIRAEDHPCVSRDVTPWSASEST